MIVRGLRLNNPGNIRKTSDRWQGLAKEQVDPSFFTFQSPVWGIRALARILVNYADDYGLDTPAKIIGRWAPVVENNTEAYIQDVCNRADWMPDETVDMQSYEDCRKMVLGIIHHENGSQPYSAMEIDEGLKLAGIVKPSSKSATVAAATDPKVIAASVVGTATVAQQVIGSISGVWDGINSLGIDPRYIMGAFGLCAAIVASWFVIDWIKRRRSGVA